MALLGWFWFSADTYMAGWNVTGESNITALGMTLNFTLWAFIGVESASVSTAVVKDPTKNVPIATVAGVILAAACYVLSSSAVMGIIPSKELIASSAPFSEAVKIALGRRPEILLPFARRWAASVRWAAGRCWSDKRQKPRQTTGCSATCLPGSTAAMCRRWGWPSLPEL